MRRALRLAERGRGLVEPNPMVGCVIVRNGHVIGEGWHRRFGGPHAEIEALLHCRGRPAGTTVYVTLEPCCIFGKTPPCTDALIEAGVSRVVAAVRDPNPRIAGVGFRALRKAGITVDTGVMEGEAAQLIAPFTKLVTRKRPWVILKWAQSLDGKIATHRGESKWISDATARRHAHATRGRVDAILIGVQTVLSDDPELTCRHVAPRRIATRVILDSRLRTPPKSNVARTARDVPTWVFHGPAAPVAHARELERAGCRLVRVPSRRTGLSLPHVLDELGAAAMTNLLVEGGGRVHGSFIDQKLADEVQIYISPILIGGRGAVAPLEGVGPGTIADATQFDGRPALIRLGDGWFFDARLTPLNATGRRFSAPNG